MLTSLLAQSPFDGTMLAILTAFVMVYWIAKRFLFFPILDLLEERSAEIAVAQETFVGAKAEVEAELEAQQAKMAEERGQARAERDGIRRQAQKAREEMVAETQRLADEKLEAAGVELRSVVASESQSLETKAVGLAREMAEKLSGKAS